MLLVHFNREHVGVAENADGISPSKSIRILMGIRCSGWENRRRGWQIDFLDTRRAASQVGPTTG